MQQRPLRAHILETRETEARESGVLFSDAEIGSTVCFRAARHRLAPPNSTALRHVGGGASTFGRRHLVARL